MPLYGLIFGLSITFATTAQAQTFGSAGENRTQNRLVNKQFRADDRITDMELKAQAGSLSRYSLKFDLSYSGPPLDNLNDPEMPNPDHRPRNNRTSLAGYVGLRYRVNPTSAFNLNTGLRWFSPYHQVAGEKVEKSPGEKDYEIANPQIGYDRTSALGMVQMRSGVKGSATTQDYYQERGQMGALGLSHALKYTVGDSRWILGLSNDLDVYAYTRAYEARDGRVSNYYLSFIPSLEYKILDKLNFKTSLAVSFANLRRLGSWWTWEEQLVTQRVGLGWALTRDVYFNPYLNFFTEKPAIKTTSVSFSTVFSIF